jgi:putative ABC transport system permease protein
MRDIRYSIRVLLKNRAFTATALLTLAHGIGVTTAIFSVDDSVLLRPLPMKDADRVVAIWEHNLRAGVDRNEMAPATFYQPVDRGFEAKLKERLAWWDARRQGKSD